MDASRIIRKAIDFVKKELDGNDSSHDWFHIERVWKLSKRIAEEEGVKNTEIIELAALLHDVKDWKYSGSETAGEEAVKEFLLLGGYEPEGIERIVQIIRGVSFKNELANKVDVSILPELAIVQDADRLDAIGAIGIGRVFAYSGSKKRPMHDPSIPRPIEMTKEQYMNKDPAKDTSINHFYEKLLKLSGMMKTSAGKQIAAQRHQFMENFIEQFLLEWDGEK